VKLLKIEYNNDRLRLMWQNNLIYGSGVKEKTVDAMLAALTSYGTFTKNQPFRLLKQNTAKSFRNHLVYNIDPKRNLSLSSSSIVHTLCQVKSFFEWLMKCKGYRSVDAIAVQWLRPTTHDLAVARNPKPRPVPDYDEVIVMFHGAPEQTLEQRRDKAILAALILYAPRVDALASLHLGDVNIDDMSIFQDASHVRVKSSKSQTTEPVNFYPEVLEYFQQWVQFLKVSGLPNSKALFPQNAALESGTLFFGVVTADLKPWQTSGPPRRIITAMFKNAGMPHYTPHSFRKCILAKAFSIGIHAGELLALSKNIGHESIETTIHYYGIDDENWQKRQLERLSKRSLTDFKQNQTIEALIEMCRDKPELAQKLVDLMTLNEK
jgi:integrase